MNVRKTLPLFVEYCGDPNMLLVIHGRWAVVFPLHRILQHAEKHTRVCFGRCERLGLWVCIYIYTCMCKMHVVHVETSSQFASPVLLITLPRSREGWGDLRHGGCCATVVPWNHGIFSKTRMQSQGSQPRFPGWLCFSLLTCWEGQPTLPIFGRCHENFFIAWRYLLDFRCAEVISPRQKTLLIMRLVCIIHHFSHIEAGLIGGNLCLHSTCGWWFQFWQLPFMKLT